MVDGGRSRGGGCLLKYTDNIATRQSQALANSTTRLDKRIDELVEGQRLGLGLRHRNDNDRPRPSDSSNRRSPSREADHEEAHRDDDEPLQGDDEAMSRWASIPDT